MRARTISVISGKGGVGKSTVTANLGALLSSKFKKSVVIIDCNLSTSHLSLSLGMYYCPLTINNAMRGENHIFEVLYDHPSGMKVVPASLNMKDLEGIDITKLKDVIKDLKDRVDFILLDTSPGLGREAYAAIHACDEALIVTNPNIPAVADVIKCREILRDVSKVPLGIVLNMVSGKDYELSEREVESMTGMNVLASVPHDRDVHRSLARKMPVTMFRPNAKSSKELMRLSRWLVGEKEEGFFKRLFG
jgi:septum site-determining protein MinD